jgi:hypothetical protein
MLPGLARNVAVAMLNLNLGVDTSFTRPMRVSGLKSSGAPNALIHFYKVTRVYYLTGHRDCTIDEVLHDESDWLGDMSRDNLNTIVRRHVLSETIKAMREKGRADRLAGLPAKGPFPGHADLLMLAKLRKAD